jgi:sulfate adenylyltransferase subunit 2
MMMEDIPIVPLYFAKKRPVVERDGTLIMVDDERMKMKPGESPKCGWSGSARWAAIP